MEAALLIEIVKVIGYLVLGGIALYLNTKGNLKGKAAAFITEAEEAYKDATNAGGVKFEYVVDKLYALVPAALKIFITRKMLAQIVQGTFDSIEAYAVTQLDKAAEAAKASIGGEADK